MDAEAGRCKNSYRAALGHFNVAKPAEAVNIRSFHGFVAPEKAGAACIVHVGKLTDPVALFLRRLDRDDVIVAHEGVKWQLPLARFVSIYVGASEKKYVATFHLCVAPDTTATSKLFDLQVGK